MGWRDQLNKMRSYFVEEDEEDYVEEQEVGSTPTPKTAPTRPQQEGTRPPVQSVPRPVPAPETTISSRTSGNTYGRRVGGNSGMQSAYVSQPAPATNTFNTTRAATVAVPTISIKEPHVYSDVMEMANFIKKGQSALINFRNMSDQQARRSIDFLTGVAYAFEGDIQNIGGQIFLVTPAGVTVEGAGDLSMLTGQNFDNMENFNLQ